MFQIFTIRSKEFVLASLCFSDLHKKKYQSQIYNELATYKSIVLTR